MNLNETLHDPRELRELVEQGLASCSKERLVLELELFSVPLRSRRPELHTVVTADPAKKASADDVFDAVQAVLTNRFGGTFEGRIGVRAATRSAKTGLRKELGCWMRAIQTEWEN